MLGKQTAAAQFNDGADIILPIAGATGTGAYRSAAELNSQEIWVIGADTAQDHLAPATNSVSPKRVSTFAVFDACKQIVDGNFVTGVQNLGLSEGGVSIILYEIARPPKSKTRPVVMRRLSSTVRSNAVDDDTLAAFGFRRLRPRSKQPRWPARPRSFSTSSHGRLQNRSRPLRKTSGSDA